MAIFKTDFVDIDLGRGQIHRSFLNHSIGTQDQQADHFGIRVLRDGEAVDLTGITVQGVFMPTTGSPIAITGEDYTSVEGNTAEVILPQACYNYEGNFTLAIKLVDATNTVTGTMRIVDGVVDNTNASGTVAPTGSVPTYQEILAVYAEMVTALVTVDELDDEVSGLKSDFDKYESLTNDGTYTIKSSDMESGSWGYSTPVTNSKRLRNKQFIPVRAGMVVYYTNPTLKVYFGVLETPTSNTYLQQSGWGGTGGVNYPYSINYDGYMTFIVESTNNISVSDYDCTVVLSTEHLVDYGNNALKFLEMTESKANTTYSKLTANLPGNTYSWISGGWFTDAPSGSYWIYTFASDKKKSGYASQIAFSPYSNTLKTRNKNYSSESWSWGDWLDIADNANTFIYRGVLPNETDADDVDKTGIYGIDSEYAYSNMSSVVSSGGFLFVIKYSSSIVSQIALSITGENSEQRRKTSGSWSTWGNTSAKVLNDNALKYISVTESTAETIYSNLAANLPGNTFAWVYGAWFDDIPYSGLFWIYTYSDKTSYTLFASQKIIKPSTGEEYVRNKASNGSSWVWGDWIKIEKTVFTTQKKYIAIGDSITYGQTSDGTSRASVPYPTIVGKQLGLETENDGVGGMGFLNRTYAGGVVFYEKVQTVDFTNACLVTIAGGINDTAYSLGTHSDVSGASTICGQIKACIEWILSHSNNYLQIIVISPMRTGVDFDYVYTGGWSIKGDGVTSFEHEVGEICKSYNIPLIGWSDMTLCQHWTTICTDNVHPDTEAYKHMGEYITGKISKYFY